MAENKTQVTNNTNENNTQPETWDTLIEYHKGVRELLFNITDNFAKIKAYILGRDYNDEELNELIDGVEKTLREIAGEIDTITEAHGKIEERDGKKVLLLKSGPINIDDNKEVEIYINVAQVYLAIFNKLTAVATTSIMSIMSRITTLEGGDNKEIEAVMKELQSLTNGGKDNGEQQ